MTSEITNKLDQLEEIARTEHKACVSNLQTAVQHAIRAGEALLDAKELVEPGTWMEWVETKAGMNFRTAATYMRFATYRDQIPAAAETMTAARSNLVGLPPLRDFSLSIGDFVKHPPEVREEAKALLDSGMSLRETARKVGVHRQTLARWFNPESAETFAKHQREAARRRRAARTALLEKEKREQRERAARTAGGALSEAYSRLRLHIEALDRAVAEADDPSVRATLRAALGHAYKAEDKICEALRVT